MRDSLGQLKGGFAVLVRQCALYADSETTLSEVAQLQEQRFDYSELASITKAKRGRLTHQLHPAFPYLGTSASTANAGSKPEPLGTSG